MDCKLNLSQLGEFGLIDNIKKAFSTIPLHDAEGIGDDCAVLPLSESEAYVVTSDMLVETKHFLLDDITPFELGYKTLAVNISDVAAMGAVPLFSFLSVALSPSVNAQWCAEFIEGYKTLSAKYNIALLGGDTTAAPDGALTLSVTAVGRVDKKNIKRRNMAQVGDIIALSGTVGDSGTALQMILTGEEPPTPLRMKHYMPQPHIEQGIWLGMQSGVHAMMDVSDGIASDLRHICTASSVGATIKTNNLPTSELMQNVCLKHQWNTTDMALSSGEDYILLLTVAPEAWDDINRRFNEQFGYNLFAVGTIDYEKNLIFASENGETYNYQNGFTHF